MKKKTFIISSVLLTMLFSCLAAYRGFPLATYRVFPQAAAAWWVITSVVEVPICTARITNKLEIENDVSAVKSYIVQSLQLGMTPDEVADTLNKIAPTHVKNSFVGENKKTHMELLVELCGNPLGNMVLLVSYSQDGHLLSVIDAYEE